MTATPRQALNELYALTTQAPVPKTVHDNATAIAQFIDNALEQYEKLLEETPEEQ